MAPTKYVHFGHVLFSSSILYLGLAKAPRCYQAMPMTIWRLSLLTRLVWRRRLRAVAATMLLAALALAAWFARPNPVMSVPLVQVIDGDSR